MSVNWQTPFQNMINALHANGSSTVQAYLSQTASWNPAIQAWITANNPYTSLTWSPGSVVVDQWGVNSILSALAMYGPIYDYDNSTFSSGAGAGYDSLMGAIATCATHALTLGPPFTGVKPAALIIGYPGGVLVGWQ